MINMSNTAKKITAIAFIVIAVSFSLFARGESETEAESISKRGVTTSIPLDSQVSFLSTLMTGVGNVLGDLTASVAIGLHPFPQILARFYKFDDLESGAVIAYGNDFNASTDMLTQMGYSVDGSEIEYDSNTGLYTISINGVKERVNWGNSSANRWGIVTMLFGLLLAAEIVFTAVFGYVMPEQEGVPLFKVIATKIAKALVLFALAAALPFLLEAIRYGLFRIAETYQDPTVEIDTMFDLPSAFMRQVSQLVNTLDWRNDVTSVFGGTNSGTLLDKLAFSVIGKLLMAIVYIVFQFVLCLEVFKTALHIVMNVIEVYLLLSVVIILLPFSIFTPTKSLVQGCVQTLFLNLIECFVIMMVVIMVVPATIRAADALYELMGTNGRTAKMSLVATATVEKFKDMENVTIEYQFDFMTRGQAIAIASSYRYVDAKGVVQENGYYSHVWYNINTLTGENLGSTEVTVNGEKQQIEKQKAIAVGLSSAWEKAGYTYIPWDELKGDALVLSSFEGKVALSEDPDEETYEVFREHQYLTDFSRKSRERMLAGHYAELMIKNVLIRARRAMVGGAAWSGAGEVLSKSFTYVAGGVALVVGGVVCLACAPFTAGASAAGFVAGAAAVYAGAKTVNTVSESDFDGAWKNLWSNNNTIGNTMCVQSIMQGSSQTTWRNSFMSELKDQKAEIMINAQAQESEELVSTNDSLIGAMVVAWILAMLPCYFVKQSSQITNGLRSGYVGFESFANSTSHALQSMGRGIGAMVSLVSRGVGMISKGVEQANQRQANAENHTIAENLRRGDNMNSSDS